MRAWQVITGYGLLSVLIVALHIGGIIVVVWLVVTLLRMMGVL